MFDPCWPMWGPICWEPWPASICYSANYLWRLWLCMPVIKRGAPRCPDWRKTLHGYSPSCLPFPTAWMSNTLNLMYQQILLNYLYVVEACVCVFRCTSGGPKWHSCGGPRSAVGAHPSVLAFTRQQGRDAHFLPFQRYGRLAGANTYVSPPESDEGTCF